MNIYNVLCGKLRTDIKLHFRIKNPENNCARNR